MRHQGVKRLSLKPATEADLEFCESLARSNMSAYLSARGISWDPARYLASWAAFENLVICLDERRVGLLRLLLLDGALEIRDLQVLASHAGQSIGTWAVNQAVAQAVARGVGLLRLRVYEENPARHLYARAGFTVETTDKGIVHMAYALPSNERAATNARPDWAAS